MGGGKSSGSSSSAPVVTQEQKDLLAAQTGWLKNTAFPAYQQTLGQAKSIYDITNPAATTAAQTALDVTGRTGALQEEAGAQSLGGGLYNLQNLFSEKYKQQQINASLQPAIEDIREQENAQNAAYGGAGGLGSSRAALANRNLYSLSQARLGNVAANVSANVEAQRQAAANTQINTGQAALAAAQQAAANRVSLANAPLDTLSKYSAIIYGTPQASTTPNFQGTQGTTGSTSGKGLGFKI